MEMSLFFFSIVQFCNFLFFSFLFFFNLTSSDSPRPTQTWLWEPQRENAQIRGRWSHDDEGGVHQDEAGTGGVSSSRGHLMSAAHYRVHICLILTVPCLISHSFSEYLAVFKKTVQVHEVFLQRLSSHPILSKDRNFHIFLEYDQDVSL